MTLGTVFPFDNVCAIFLSDLSTGKTFCFFTFNVFQILLIIFPQGFHSVRDATIFSSPPNSKLWLLLTCLTFLMYLSPRSDIFLFKHDFQFCTSPFIFPFIVLAPSPYHNRLIALILFVCFFIPAAYFSAIGLQKMLFSSCGSLWPTPLNFFS